VYCQITVEEEAKPLITFTNDLEELGGFLEIMM
jgi:hypothetical protein